MHFLPMTILLSMTSAKIKLRILELDAQGHHKSEKEPCAGRRHGVKVGRLSGGASINDIHSFLGGGKKEFHVSITFSYCKGKFIWV